jgi:iron complex transport system substrate-binding protein
MKKCSKQFLTAILGMTIIMTATGCQSTKKQSTNETLPAKETQANETQASETRKVHTVMGDIEVPSDPKRVVVNWYTGDVLALDLNVVGYFGWSYEGMPFYDKMKATTEIKNWDQEEVMALDPDLIVTYSKDDYDKFSSIAPVIVIPEGELNSLDRVLFLGESTGRKDKAQAAVDNFQSKLATAKETLNGDAFKDKTFSINEDWGSGSYGVYYESESRGGTLLYQYLGLKKPEKLEQLIKDSGETRGGLSYEVAADYFGDYMIWFHLYDSTEGEPSEYEKTPIWSSLPAVQENQVVSIPGKMAGLFFYSDVTSLTAQLDYIVEAINSTVK